MAYTTIDNPELYFQTKLYTGQASAQGDGTTTAITFDGSEDMQPDLIWIKNRDGTDWHDVTDSVRGVTKSIYPNENDGEDTVATAVTAIGSDGFTVGSNDQVNDASDKYVAWCWKESATAGFDIVTYTGNGTAGNTVSHSLSAAPTWVVVKKRSAAGQWAVGHKAMDSGFDYFLFLDATDAKGNADNVFNDTAPSSSVITLGNAGDTNANTQTYVAYLWTDIQGFSKFGIYTGNGNADGPFIHTGFSPSFVMTHNTETASQWTMWDNKRTANSNLKDEVLYANGTNAEATAATESVDFLSNGFKIRGNNSGINTSGEIYIYMAFAEAPFVNSKGAPANAR